jgi:choline dehydrogenase
LQDQPNLSLAYSGLINTTGYAPYATFVTAQDLYGNNTAAVSAEVRSGLSRWAAHIASQRHSGIDVKAIERILAIQHELIFVQNVTIGELLTTASGSTLVTSFWALLPFSRGSVHLQSTSVEDTNSPRINPAFFEIDFDLAMQVAVGRLAQEYWTVAPVKDWVVENISPGDSVLPMPASEEQWASFIRDSCKYSLIGNANFKPGNGQ